MIESRLTLAPTSTLTQEQLNYCSWTCPPCTLYSIIM